MKKLVIKDLCLIAVLTAVLFVQEQLFSFLPNITLTVFLIILYSKCLGFVRCSLIVVIHTLLDNLFMGSLNMVYFPFMLLGWLIIPITLCSVFKRVSRPLPLAFLGIIFSLLYCWIFIIPQVLITEVDIHDYFIADIPFEIILALGTFLAVLWLYQPLKKVIDQFIKKDERQL